MRLSVLAVVIALTGCVSQNQSGGYQGDNFDMQEAAKTRVSLGLTYLKNGNYQQAKLNLDKALEFAPRSADAHYAMAYYYQTVEEWSRAEGSYEDALDLAPRNADIANSYGAFLCQQKQYDKATSYFTKALNNTQYANSAQTYENMAICAQEQGKDDDAIQFLQSALNHQPGRAQSLFMLTELQIKAEQWEQAEASMRRYERVSRVSPESISLAIAIAKGKGDLDTADGYGEMLTTMYPQSEAAKTYREALKAQNNAQVIRKTKTRSVPEPVVTETDEPELTAPEPEAEDAVETTSTNDEPVNSTASEPAASEDTAESSADSVEESAGNTAADEEQQQDQTNLSEGDDADTESRYHVVARGENLYRISVKYNIKMQRLQAWNDLVDPGDITVGMKLKLTPPDNEQVDE